MSDLHDRTAELYRAFGPRVYRRCLRILADEEAAHDATQEVFLRLLANMPRLQEREELLPWILNVARNHCLNLRRAARQDAVLSSALEREEPATTSDLNRALLARALLARADPAMRRVILGVLGAGLRHEDAAAELGLSPATVARKIQRFLATSREYMTQSEYVEAQHSPRAATAIAPPRLPAQPAAPKPWRRLDDAEPAAA